MNINWRNVGIVILSSSVAAQVADSMRIALVVIWLITATITLIAPRIVGFHAANK